MADKDRNSQVLAGNALMGCSSPAAATTSISTRNTKPVRINVAMSALTWLIPTLAKMAVSAANSAEPSAQASHGGTDWVMATSLGSHSAKARAPARPMAHQDNAPPSKR